jgi:hypothetical protein
MRLFPTPSGRFSNPACVASTQQEAVIQLICKLKNRVMQTGIKCVNAVGFAQISRLSPNPHFCGLYG